MNMNEYQELAQRTANLKLDFDRRLSVAGLGLVGEGGEVAELIKKHLGHGHELNIDEMVKELGDAMWYIAEVCSLLNINMEYVAKANIEKLKRRYPEGFSEEKSIHRVED